MNAWNVNKQLFQKKRANLDDENVFDDAIDKVDDALNATSGV